MAQFPLRSPSSSDDPSIYNQFYFTIPDVKAGPHTLTVTFLGDNQTTPLCLDYLYVKNGTFPTSADPSSTTPNGTPGSESHIGAIIGDVLGGLAFIIVIMGGLLFWRHRKVRQSPQGGSFIPAEGSEYNTTPFDPYSDRRLDFMVQVHQPQFNTTISSPVLSPPMWQQLSAPRKQVGAFRMATRPTIYHAVNGKVNRTGPVGTASESTSLPLPQATTTETSAVQQHMDSGIWLNTQPIVDIPPHYTPE